MAVSPILLHGTIQQTDNVLHNQLKQIEKGAVDQGNIHVEEVKKEEQQAKQIVRSENSKMMDERFDAKEKGKNAYTGDGGKDRKPPKGDGRIIVKSEAGFDMKI